MEETQNPLLSIYKSLRSCCDSLDHARRTLYEDKTLPERVKSDLSGAIATSTADILAAIDIAFIELTDKEGAI